MKQRDSHTAIRSETINSICYSAHISKINRRSENVCNYSVIILKNITITLHRTRMLPAVWCWSLDPREQPGMKAFQNWMPNGGKVTGEQRKLQNEEVRNLYSSTKIIMVMNW